MSKRGKLTIIGILLVLVVGFIGGYFLFLPEVEFESKTITVEVNGEFNPKDNIKKVRKIKEEDIKINDEAVKLNQLGEYSIVYSTSNKDYEVKVKVVDTVNPEYSVKDIELFLGEKVDINTIVSDVKDQTKTEVYFDKDYSFDKDGEHKVKVVVEDEAGNKTKKDVLVKIVKDTEKPTLSGVRDRSVYVNGKIDYLDGIVAKDNRATDPKITVDSSAVDLSKTGTYTIKYSVEDLDSNIGEYTANVIVKERPVNVDDDSPEKTIYLTFDDGPSFNTEKILDILDRYNVKATFFVIGTNSNYNHLIKRAYDSGHTIGLHSYTHDYSIYRSVATYFDDLNKISDLVYSITGERSKVIRFPGGSSNTISRNYKVGIMSALVEEVRAQGYQYYDWNISSADANGNTMPTSTIIRESKTGAGYKNVNLLMHDTGAKTTTVEALPTIIEYYLDLGYTFKAINTNSFAPHHGTNN